MRATTSTLNIIKAGMASAVSLFAATATAQFPFEEFLDTGNIGDTPVDMGASWGDCDDDGDIDLYMTSSGDHRVNPVYANNGAGRFTRMTPSAIGELATDMSDAEMGVWGDLDSDGDLDLYVANFVVGPWDASSPAAADVVYENTARGFRKHDGSEFSTSPRFSSVPSLGDYDGDGLLDVLLSTWPWVGTARDVLYHNRGSLDSFESVPLPSQPTMGVGGTWADVDNDGDQDILAANMSNDHNCRLYLNQTAQGTPGVFDDSTAFPAGGVFPTKVRGGAPWGDVDNDGDLDVLMTRREAGLTLLINNGNGSFSALDVALKKDMRSTTGAWLDADNDSDLDIVLGTLHGDERAFVYLQNLGGNVFEEQTIVDGILPNGWRGVAVGDFNNDGFMDFLLPISAPSGSSVEESRDRMFRNIANHNHWLKFVLKGTVSNGSAIGAIVRVKTLAHDGEGTWQMRQVSAGGETLWVQHDMRPNFGLGNARVAEVVRIEWPSGIVQELTNVPADQILTIVEPVRLMLDAPDRLSWYSSRATTFDLESAPTVNGPWTDATETVEVDGMRRWATVDPAAGTRFYRLRGSKPTFTPLPLNPDPEHLLWIPAGTFLMGSPDTEPEREPLTATTGYGDETLHEVILTQGFWMSRFETTQPEFLDLLGSNPSTFAGPATQPVDSVTWHEAMAYCEALTAREEAAGRLPEGYVYRLPTEAEWEYACRAGTSTAFPTGEELRSRQANFDGTREYSVSEGGTVANPAGVAVPRPLPVGRPPYVANAWGLRDMYGNVSEWCLDQMYSYPDGPVTDPYIARGPTEELGAVLRGGAWGEPASVCRSASRDYKAPSVRDSHVGFRVMLGRPLGPGGE